MLLRDVQQLLMFSGNRTRRFQKISIYFISSLYLKNYIFVFFQIFQISALCKYLNIYLSISIYLSIYLSVYLYIYLYGIPHWRIIWSSYRRLAWVGFELTTTEFRSDALTDWGISSTRTQSQLCTATPI